MVTNVTITGTGVGIGLFPFFNLFEIPTISLLEIYSSDVFLLSSIVPIKVYNNADTMKKEILRDNYKKAGVYKWLNNLSGKFYIGSSINLSNRLRLYYNYDYISDSSKGNSIIHQALINYGYSNFTLEIMEYCDADKVIELEQHYFNTLNPEYNILKTAGNSLGFKHSEDTKLKISATKLGSSHTEETKLRFKEVRKGTNAKNNNPFFGKCHTAESKAKISAAQSCIIYVYSSDRSTLINTFNSSVKAGEHFNVSYNTILNYARNGLLFKKQWYLSTKLIS